MSVLPDSKTATTAPGGPYNLRAGPGTGYEITGSRDGNVSVTITCTSRGESVTGHYGTSRVWDKLANGSWITDTNVYTGTDGPAARPCIRNDYPYASSSTSGVDAWNFYNRQCTSFSAHRINWNGTRTGKTFTNWYLGEHFGDAHLWDDAARASGVALYAKPAVGRIAQWNRNVGGAGGFGHVGVRGRRLRGRELPAGGIQLGDGVRVRNPAHLPGKRVLAQQLHRLLSVHRG